MTDLVTIRAFVATSPNTNKLPSGIPVTNFRVASTPRWWDSQQQVFKEGQTNWYTVNAFRALAQHTSRSIFVGQPVIVTGRLNIKQWSNEDGRKGTSVEIDATAIGHDLNLGTSSFNSAIQPESQENQKEQTPQQTHSLHQTTNSSHHQADQSNAYDSNSPQQTSQQDGAGLVEGNTRDNQEIAAMV